MKNRYVFQRVVASVMLVVLFAVATAVAGRAAVASEPITVQTIIENDSIFPEDIEGRYLYMTVGDLTNDGSTYLVITKGLEPDGARAAVFQNPGGLWDSGTLLTGPTEYLAWYPIVAPIRNDGQNWLVYSDHRRGNTGEWLRTHRYSGTAMVENKDFTSAFGWPGRFAPGVGDLDGDSDLEIWFVENHGTFPCPYHHLRRHTWDAATNSYPGVEIKNGGECSSPLMKPLAGDFLGNGTQSLIWVAQSRELDLVTYTPGSGVHDHTSSPIFSPSADMHSFDAGEFDGVPGTDIAVATWDGSSSAAFVISGGTFGVTQIASGVSEELTVIRMGDLGGDGLVEVYAAGKDGGVYGYDTARGWRQLSSHPDARWWDGATARWTGAVRDAVLFFFGGGSVAEPSV